MTGDTIVAISSAVGAGARMIVRMSGPDAHRIAGPLCGTATSALAQAARRHLSFGGLPVSAWLYTFISPHSYTGEDLVELHIPGNPLLARMLLDELVARGARPAEPGEFTARAYFNGRIDLTQAEGVAATIAAHGQQELAAARQLLAGELARRLRPTMDLIAETLALVEAGIDFAEEDVSFLSPQQIEERIVQADSDLQQLLDQSSRFERLVHEPQIVLIGRPNAGKSTLLNALARQERAVVSSTPGTTRDAIWAEAALPHGLVRIIDVAGLAEEEDQGTGEGVERDIAKQMHRRALQTLREADRVVLVVDATDARPPLELDRSPDLVIRSKSDLADHALTPALSQRERAMRVSAVSGMNMEALRRRLDELAFGPLSGSSSLALNQRHRTEIDAARHALSRIVGRADQLGLELLALELREALDALGRILGSVTPDDLLGRIFAAFCIGK